MLKKNIANKDFSELYVLYGEEKFALKTRAKKLIDKVSPDNFREFNLNEFSSSASVDTIADAALAVPFMAERKCVVVSDYDINSLSETEYKKLDELISSLSDMTVLIFVYPTVVRENKGNWSKFLKKAEKKGTVTEFKPLEKKELVPYLTKYASDRNSSISAKTVGMLIDFVGTDMNRLRSELEKLCAYCQGREINAADIDLLTAKTAEVRAFDLVKNLVNNNFSAAYTILYRLIQDKEKPQGILAMIANQYIHMYRARCEIESGNKADHAASYDPASYKGREWMLTSAEKNASRLSTAQIVACLDACLETDMLMKSSKMARIDDGYILLQELISKILLITRGENRSKNG